MDSEKFRNSFMVALGCFIGLAIMIAAATFINYATSKESGIDTFYKQCESACLPNGVYSAKHNRCMCDVNIVYREIK